MSIKPTVVLLIMVACLGSSETCNAFKPKVHDEITEAALKMSTRSGLANTTSPKLGTAVAFSAWAILDVSQANQDVDSFALLTPGATAAGLMPGTAKQHFDNTLMQAGAAYVREQKLAILSKLAATNGALEIFTSLDVLEARRLLGYALHTIQDFYAHSNWVERIRNAQSDATVDFARLDQGDHPSGACDGDGATAGTRFLDGTISGYFDLPELSENTPEVRALADLCNHGINLAGYAFVEGINKDEPGVLADQNGTHIEAKRLATLSSAQFVSEILTALVSSGSTRALCRFLGYVVDCTSVEPYSSPIVFQFDAYGPAKLQNGIVYRELNQAITMPYPRFDRGRVLQVRTRITIEFAGSMHCPPKPPSTSLPIGATWTCALNSSASIGSSTGIFCEDSVAGGAGSVTCNFDPGVAQLSLVQQDLNSSFRRVTPARERVVSVTQNYVPPYGPSQFTIDLSQRVSVYPLVDFGDGTFLPRGSEEATFTDGRVIVTVEVSYVYI